MTYKDLLSYQMATIVYDLTDVFVGKYINPRSRTCDQMIQAARSGKQNIVEGCSERTSKKSELKLLGVARASFKELLEDYEDYLRQHRLPLWSKNSTQSLVVRRLSYMSDKSYMTYMSYIEKPEPAANCLICLTAQTGYLVDRQITKAEDDFARHGGYTENLFKRRLRER